MPSTDLVVDGIYPGGRAGNASDDPLGQLVGVSNSGGFRYLGSLEKLALVVLTTSRSDPNWPDELDKENGVFTYYGDNKDPGRELHDTPRFGNEILRRLFEQAVHASGRSCVPPILAFANTGTYRDVTFLGLLVPGLAGHSATEDLAAIWRATNGRRFQNYRARFSILDVPVVSRDWINDIISGRALSDRAPRSWLEWIETGRPRNLVAPRTVEYRSRDEQLPSDPASMKLIEELHRHYAPNPHAFEHCASAIVKMMLPGVLHIDVTRPSRDGGRDGVGLLTIGAAAASIAIDFALEAKCYSISNSVGVREISRLISRLRHRQFGILVTTSYLDRQAYREIKEDGHPIIVVSAVDIVGILMKSGVATLGDLEAWISELQKSEAGVS
jgi:Restriction endonuclease AspBHI N-terminal/Restriction endonuclease